MDRWAMAIRLADRVAGSETPGPSAQLFWNPTFQDDDPEIPEEPEDESIHDVEYADDLAKHQEERRDVIDRAHESFVFIRPDGIDDAIRS